MIELAPSILSADFAHLADQVARAAAGGGSIIHVDVMDGHFVPNITLGPQLVRSLRKATKLPLDCHLMIENPDLYIPAFADAGANWISVHQEACIHLHRTLDPGFGAQPFIPNSLHKLSKVRELREQRGLNYRIEVDGGVALDTVAKVVRAGAEILVAGNAVFSHGDPMINAQNLLKAATEATLLKV